MNSQRAVALGNRSVDQGRERTTLALLVALAIVTRLGFARLERVIKWDESDYLMLGRNLMAGRGFTTAGYPELHYPPLFPAVSGLAQQLTRDPELASEWVYALCSGLVLLPYYALARRMYGQRVAYTAIALLLFLPALAISVLYWGTMSEPLYLLLIYSGLCLLWRGWEENQPLYQAAGGVLFALAYLARPEGILYPAVFAALYLLRQALQRRLGKKGTWWGLVALVGASFIFAAPYILYLHRHTGQWTFSGKVGVTYALGAAVIERDPAAYDRATASLDSTGRHLIWFSPERFRGRGMLSEIMHDPLAFAKRMAANARRWLELFFSRASFPGWLLVFVVLGWCKAPWDRKRLWQEAFLTAALLPPFGFLALHIETRFFAPLLPVLLLWTAKGLDEAGLWCRDTVLAWRSQRPFAWRRWEEVLRTLPLTFALILLALLLPLVARDGQRGTDFTPKQVGLWLREHAPLEARIMSRDVAVAVYAERDWVPSPHADWPSFLAYARFHEVDYLIVTEWEATVLRPSLRFLLEESNLPPELELVHVEQGSHGRTLAYRLR